jgi:hypothetical protein
VAFYGAHTQKKPVGYFLVAKVSYYELENFYFPLAKGSGWSNTARRQRGIAYATTSAA